MDQEYTELSNGNYKGFNYKLLKLKYNAGFGGVIMPDGVFKYEIHITNKEGDDANIFIKTRTALKEHAESMIDQLIKNKSL